MNVMIPGLENFYVFANGFFKLTSNLFQQLLLQRKDLYNIKSFLTFAYLRKHSQSLYVIPYVLHALLPCPRLHLIL